jgi:hypothetical protein
VLGNLVTQQHLMFMARNRAGDLPTRLYRLQHRHIDTVDQIDLATLLIRQLGHQNRCCQINTVSAPHMLHHPGIEKFGDNRPV